MKIPHYWQQYLNIKSQHLCLIKKWITGSATRFYLLTYFIFTDEGRTLRIVSQASSVGYMRRSMYDRCQQ